MTQNSSLSCSILKKRNSPSNCSSCLSSVSVFSGPTVPDTTLYPTLPRTLLLFFSHSLPIFCANTHTMTKFSDSLMELSRTPGTRLGMILLTEHLEQLRTCSLIDSAALCSLRFRCVFLMKLWRVNLRVWVPCKDGKTMLACFQHLLRA